MRTFDRRRAATAPVPQNGHKVAFLDRDGVINEAPKAQHYIQTWEQFRFATGALDMLKALTDHGYRLVVITNQQGVAKGLVQPQALSAIHRNLCAAVAECGAVIDGVFFCPHLEAHDCACRKPKPGLIQQALVALDYPVDMARSWMIGDSGRDIEAGAAMGLHTLLIGSSDHAAAAKATLVAANQQAAGQLLLGTDAQSDGE